MAIAAVIISGNSSGSAGNGTALIDSILTGYNDDFDLEVLIDDDGNVLTGV